MKVGALVGIMFAASPKFLCLAAFTAVATVQVPGPVTSGVPDLAARVRTFIPLECCACTLTPTLRPASRPNVLAAKFKVSSAAIRRSIPTAPTGMSLSAMLALAKLATTASGTLVSSVANYPAKPLVIV